MRHNRTTRHDMTRHNTARHATRHTTNDERGRVHRCRVGLPCGLLRALATFSLLLLLLSSTDEALSPFSNFRFFGGEPEEVVEVEADAGMASSPGDRLLRLGGEGMMMNDDDGEPGAGIG